MTFRTVIRLMRSVRLLDSASITTQLEWAGAHGTNDSLQAAEKLFAAFTVVVSGQLLHLPRVATKLTEVFCSALQVRPLAEATSSARAGSSVQYVGTSRDHVLTASRQRYHDSVLACVKCGFPVLLEGPAAVGKTSLIKAMCTTGFEIVNNTDSTTIQDYLGCVIPQVSASSCKFRCRSHTEHIVVLLASTRRLTVSSKREPCIEQSQTDIG